MASAHTDLSLAFYLLHAAVDNGAMYKIEIGLQQRYGHFKPRMLLFSVDNSAMNTRRYCQQHNDLLRDIGNGEMNSSALLATEG